MLKVLPVDNNSKKSFGFNWTNGTPKLLKKYAYSFVSDEGGVQISKEAIVKLAALSKRQDGIVIGLTDKEGLGEIGVIVKSKVSNQFVDGEHSMIYAPDANELNQYADYLSSDEFLAEAKIMAQKSDKAPTGEKIQAAIVNLGQRVCDSIGRGFALFTWDYGMHDGRNVSRQLMLTTLLQEYKAKRPQINELRSFIDKAFASKG